MKENTKRIFIHSMDVFHISNGIQLHRPIQMLRHKKKCTFFSIAVMFFLFVGNVHAFSLQMR